MADRSNQLMALTVLAYLAAMVGHAAEYAFGQRSPVGRVATRPARQLVSAGAPTGDRPDNPLPPDGAVGKPDPAAWAGHAAVALFVLGLLASRSIADRGLSSAAGRCELCRHSPDDWFEFILVDGLAEGGSDSARSVEDHRCRNYRRRHLREGQRNPSCGVEQAGVRNLEIRGE